MQENGWDRMNAGLVPVAAADQPTPVVRERRRARSGAIRMMLYIAQGAIDVSATTLGFGIANIVRYDAIQAANLQVVLIAVPLFLVVSFYARVYAVASFQSYARAISRSIGALLIVIALILTFAFATKQTIEFSRSVVALGFMLASAFLILGRLPLVALVRHRLAGDIVRRVVVIDDIDVEVPAGFEQVSAKARGLTPDLHDPVSLSGFSWLVVGYDRVVVACPAERRKAWSLYMQAVGCPGELLLPELAGIAPTSVDSGVGTIPGIVVSAGALDLRDRVVKRILDLAIAVPVLLLLSPLLVLVALAVKLDSPGPVLFRQERMGRSNRLFHVLKFRSMRVDRTDHSGERSASRDDDRITRVGRIIRATSIDELPQLLNILQGDMSLVGPRPHALGSRAGDLLFWHIDQRYWLRHSIKPGLTGLAQVRGFRGATDHHDDLLNRLHSDLEYLQNWTFLRDLVILARTAAVVVHRNAY